MPETDKDFLFRQLDNLGQMIANGLADEPDGKWIRREYRNICRHLGIIERKPRKNLTKSINEFMAQLVKDERCNICKDELKQTRSGSFIAICSSCGRRWRLGHTKR